MPRKDKEAHKQYCRERYQRLMQENPEPTQKYSKEYYEKHREKLINKSRDYHLKVSYNLNRDAYSLLVKQQQNLCAICQKEECRLLKTGNIKPLSIDHNHSTGKIRELLCNDCNAALGFAKENINTLQKMITYLENTMLNSMYMMPDWAGRR